MLSPALIFLIIFLVVFTFIGAKKEFQLPIKPKTKSRLFGALNGAFVGFTLFIILAGIVQYILTRQIVLYNVNEQFK